MNKISEEHLKTIKDQQERLTKLLHEIGVVEATKHSYLHHVAEINREVEDFKGELEKEYGVVNINLEDGTYTKIEEKDLQKVED
tara:strand:- start:151 stop:402 length:252 start_codon:yes stop_codon:yes gene_type:complete